jgi:hypothetical protein
LELDLTVPNGIQDLAGNGLGNTLFGDAYVIET